VLYKKVMYTLRTRVKSKHVDAFLHYGSPAKLLNLLRVETAILRGSTRDFGLPYMLTVEPTNRCNLQCPLCPTGRGLVGRPKQSMSLDRYRRLIDEIGHAVYLINFQNWGEPLLGKNVIEMIEYAHRGGIYTAIQTNGNYATRLNEPLLAAGLDHIMFAVDGSTQEVYERYRVNGKLDLVRTNVRDLLQRRAASGKSRPFVELQFLVFDDNRDDLPNVRTMARDWGVDGLLVRAAVGPGNEANRRKYYVWDTQRGFCRRFWYTASINSDGGVTPCCNFFFQENDLGNVSEETFASVWNGPRYQQNRRAVATHDYAALHANCKACKIYHGPLMSTAYGVLDGGAPAQRSARPSLPIV
jgi:radical SAM protein with 4Fe4S-binding SPASM domain